MTRTNQLHHRCRGTAPRVSVLAVLVAATLVACGPPPSRSAAPSSTGPQSPSASPTSSMSVEVTVTPDTDAQQESTMIITVNGHDLPVALADNSSARALADLVGGGALELTLEDYGGFERVGSLPHALPTNDEQITTQPGDVILYQGDKLTIYYATNSWTFTRIGRITGVDADELREVLGDGEVTVTLHTP